MIITTVRSPLASTVLNLGASELTCTSESERVEPGSDQSSHLAHDGPGRVPGDTGDDDRVVAGAGHVHHHTLHLETLGAWPILGDIPGHTNGGRHVM